MFGLTDLLEYAGKKLVHGVEDLFSGSSPSTSAPVLPGMTGFTAAGFTPGIAPSTSMASTSNGVVGALTHPLDAIENAMGYNVVPMKGASNGSTPAGCPPATMAPTVTQRTHCQPGYVAVEWPKGSGTRVCMRKELARAYHLWKPARKPPISVKDWRALQRADRTVRRLDIVVKKSNNVVGKHKMRRCAPTPKKTTRRR